MKEKFEFDEVITMKEIKTMLLGIAIMLATIVIHLFIADQLFTDFIAILGICIVILGYSSKGDK